MKTNLGDPHRNFVDFGHVPVVRRLTRLPVCIDPSHSVGSRAAAPDGLLDVFHVTAQGIIAGANLVLVDFHPKPEEALCDGPQALLMKELPHFIDDARIARDAYDARIRRAAQASQSSRSSRTAG
jgi:3-deoxy-7-phosphoheptulonate synthase